MLKATIPHLSANVPPAHPERDRRARRIYRPGLTLTLAFGDVDPSDGLMAILLRLQPCVQVLEVGLQVLPVLFLRAYYPL